MRMAMRIGMRAAVAALALAGTTCCPSLFLTVHKGDPGPVPRLGEPAIVATPWLPPRDLVNRFDVLGKLTAEEQTAFDAYDPNSPERRDTSEKAFERISARFGHHGAETAEGEGAIGEPKGVQVELCLVQCDTLCHGALIDDAVLGKRKRPVFRYGASKWVSVGIERPDLDELAKPPFAACGRSYAPQALVEFPGGVAVPATTKVTVAMLDDNSTADPITSFVHFSDIQIRDPAVTLGNVLLSNHLQKIIHSFQYDYDLVFYDPFVVEGLIYTVNQIKRTLPCLRSDADGDDRGSGGGSACDVVSDDDTHGDVDRSNQLAFAIHTGDAIDAGVTSELRQFHKLWDRLDVPGYDVLGNHDVLAFGNLLPTTDDTDATCTSAISVAEGQVPWLARIGLLLPDRLCVKQKIECPDCLAGEATMVAAPDHRQSHINFMTELGTHATSDGIKFPPQPLEQDAYCHVGSGEEPIYVQKATLQHGFDLNPRQGGPTGYYAYAWDITIRGDHRHALYVVLDTNDLAEGEGGSSGRIGATQLQWLKNVLGCVQQDGHRNDLVFVFGHHGLQVTKPPLKGGLEDPTESIEHVLATSKNVIAYFYGHQHRHGICEYPGSCHDFWEVMTGSIIEFPQEAKMVRIEYAGDGLGFIELSSFGVRLANPNDDFGRAVAMSAAGSERDHCANNPQDCLNGRVVRTDGRHASGRLFFQLPEYKDFAPLVRK